MLLRWTYESAHGRGPPLSDLTPWWVAYLAPFAVVLAVAPLVACLHRQWRPQARGFAVAVTDAVGTDRRPT